MRIPKRNKISRLDGITAEMIQTGDEQLTQQIYKPCTKAWNEGTISGE